jgi:integrase
VFITSKGSAWNCDSIAQRVRRIWKSADLVAPGQDRPHVLHELRHMFATEAGRRYGADMVRAGLGHLSRQTSERYVHPDIQAADEVGRTVRQAIMDSMNGDGENPSRRNA